MADVEENQERTVWIVNRAGHNYSDAEKYGKLRALTMDNINPLAVDRLANHLARGIAGFAEEEDFVLISGTPIITGLTCTLWLMHFDKLKLLQWNAKQRKYELQVLEREQLSGLLDRHLMR